MQTRTVTPPAQFLSLGVNIRPTVVSAFDCNQLLVPNPQSKRGAKSAARVCEVKILNCNSFPDGHAVNKQM